MARKQSASVDAQIEQLRQSPGVVSLTVSKPRWYDRERDPADSRMKGRFREKIVPDARYANRPDLTDLPGVFEVVPIKTKNPCNSRQSWNVVSKRAKAEHAAVEVVLIPHREKLALLALGCTCTLTRISSGRLDPHDGLPPALKWVKDAIARVMFGGEKGQRDEDPRIEWKYEQSNLGPGRFGVVINIQPRGDNMTATDPRTAAKLFSLLLEVEELRQAVAAKDRELTALRAIVMSQGEKMAEMSGKLGRASERIQD